MNEELFRHYALWTFTTSCIYTILYLGIFLGQYRTAFFIFLGIITLTVVLYWFRDGGNKLGWQSLDESLLIVLFLSVIMVVLMGIACILAVKMTSSVSLPFSDFRATASFLFKLSPIILTAVNLINLLVFVVRNQ